MIARRLGAATRLSQSLGCTARSSCAVASTSYSHHSPHPLSPRSFASSSSPGPFAPTTSRLKKNRGAVLSELPAEEPFEEYEDTEDDLFDIGEEQQVAKPAKKTKEAVIDLVPFPEVKQSIMQRFKEMDPDEAVNVDLSDWSLLLRSARTAEEIKQCFEVSLEWKNKTYSLKSKMQKLTPKETAMIARRTRALGCSGLMYYALMDRKNNGLEYDIDMMRQIQYSLIKNNKAAYSSKGRGAVAQDSQETPSDRVMESKASRPLLKTDRLLALAAFTSVLSPSQADVDPVTLILAIGYVIKTFELMAQVLPPEEEDIYKTQIYPRLGRALKVLIATRDDVFKGIFPHSIKHRQYFSHTCETVLQVAIAKKHEVEPRIDVEMVNKRLASAVKACIPEVHSDFVKKAERMFATSTV